MIYQDNYTGRAITALHNEGFTPKDIMNIYLKFNKDYNAKYKNTFANINSIREFNKKQEYTFYRFVKMYYT